MWYVISYMYTFCVSIRGTFLMEKEEIYVYDKYISNSYVFENNVCVRACVRACVRVRVCVCVCKNKVHVFLLPKNDPIYLPFYSLWAI